MNSVLQVFFMIPAFRNLVLGQPRKDDCKTIVHNERTVTDNFLYQLQRMYTNLLLSNRRSYDPTDFCLTIKNP